MVLSYSQNKQTLNSQAVSFNPEKATTLVVHANIFHPPNNHPEGVIT
jgi:hypothetical protein